MSGEIHEVWLLQAIQRLQVHIRLYEGPILWNKTNGVYTNPDCSKWENSLEILCYNRQSCKAGVEEGFTLVNLNQGQNQYEREPFILASHVKKVFYSRE
ncbi:hypothetical protein Ddye_021767, partial [Dipteronia dyeriana]